MGRTTGCSHARSRSRCGGHGRGWRRARGLPALRPGGRGGGGRADGGCDARERRMLKLCAERWGVPYENVELALNADPALFERLVPPPGPGGEGFLRSL